MAETWNDFLLRTNLSDTGTLPGPQPASSCPDILPSGTSMVDDPQGQFSADYGSDPGQALVIDTYNTIYVRSKNLADGENTGKVQLFFADSAYILWPYSQGDKKGWSENVLEAADGKSSIEITASAKDDIAVTPRPFLWAPPPPPAGSHYCLLAGVKTEAHDQIVPTLDESDTSAKFADWIASHGNVGWRNVSLTDTGRASESRRDTFENRGDEETTFRITINCTGCPVGWTVWLESFEPGANPPIQINKTTITSDTSFGVSVESTVPANYFTVLAINVAFNGIQPSTRWDVSADAIKINKPTQAEIPILDATVMGGVAVAASL